MRRALELTERQLWCLEENTRRKILRQVMFIETEDCTYSLGANSISDSWMMYKHRHEDALKVEDGEYIYSEVDPVTHQVIRSSEATIVDEWR